MKALIVTENVIEDTGTGYRCIKNFYDIVNRFKYLGELSICAVRFNGSNSRLKIETDLAGVVDYGSVQFLKENKNLLFTLKENRTLLASMVQENDLIINYMPSYALYKLAKKYNKKFMTFLVGCLWDAYWNHGWQGKIIAPYIFFKARYVTRHSDYVLYVSNKFLQGRYPTRAKYTAGCSNVKIPVMNDETIEKRIAYLNQWNGDILNIATTGAVDVAYKGQQYVMYALRELKRIGRTNVHYYLIGGGDNSRLSSLAKRLDIEDMVHFMGIIPHDRVFELLDQIHIYFQPSLQEGLPRSMVEAMSRGLMCVGARTAAIPELIQPKYVISRKSYRDIFKVLTSVSKEELVEQAKVNFEEAKKYQDHIICARRDAFFDKIKQDMNSKK